MFGKNLETLRTFYLCILKPMFNYLKYAKQTPEFALHTSLGSE